MRHALRLVAIDEDLLYIFEAIEQTLLQAGDALVFFVHFFFGNTVSLAHAHALVRGQRARAHAALVTTAVHLRF